MLNVLILCTGNSCRSIMGEALLRHYGKGKFQVLSAGSSPTGRVHPISLETLRSKNINTDEMYSKSWDKLEHKNIDIVITVCDNAAGEACPVFLGKAIKAHWGVEDPAHYKGTDREIAVEFKRVCEILEKRVKALCELDITSFSKNELQKRLNEIGAL